MFLAILGQCVTTLDHYGNSQGGASLLAVSIYRLPPLKGVFVDRLCHSSAMEAARFVRSLKCGRRIPRCEGSTGGPFAA